MDRRRLHLALGFRSLVAYAIAELRMSEDAAYNRVQAARAGRRYPEILALIESGLLSVTTTRMLSKRLTPENARHLVQAATGKTREQVEELLAREFPQHDVRPSVRKVPSWTGSASGEVPVSRSEPAPSSGATATVFAGPTPASAPAEDTSAAPAPTPATAPPKRPEVTPLSPERYKVTFTASGQLRDKLRRVQDLMRHSIPDGDIATIFDRALTSLLEDLGRKKYAATGHPRTCVLPARTDTRDIPAEVQRAVWERDGGCCAFIGRNGRRCGSRAWLEYHHVIPYELGGQATVENIQLRCRAHNQYEAWVYFARTREASVPARAPERAPSRPATSTTAAPPATPPAAATTLMTHTALTPLSPGA
jgi:hypothetical protein